MRHPKSPTIRDVAAAAGVSIATVSKFVNRQQSFSEPVEAKVREAIETLGYSQNPMARSMVTGKTAAVGLAVMDIGNPHHANVVKGANRMALANGYNLLVVDMEERIEIARQLLEPLARRTDGLIVSARIPEEVIDWLIKLGKPVVFIGQTVHEDSFCVGMDNTLAAAMLAGYLVQQGFSRVAYVGFERADWNTERLQGLSRVFGQAGVELMSFNAEGPTCEAGERIAARVLLGPERPDLVIGCNDQVAIGLMSQAHAFGLRIPQDVAVAGFDNISTSRYVTPPLTTIDTRSEETGEAVFTHILGLIEGREVPDSLRLEPLLVVRESAKRP